MESENNKKIDLSIPAMTISFGTQSSNTSVANVFASKGIKTIRDLCMCSEEELVRLPTVGYGRSLHIRKFLKMYGLELGMTEDELTAYETNAREEEMVAKLQRQSENFSLILQTCPIRLSNSMKPQKGCKL